MTLIEELFDWHVTELNVLKIYLWEKNVQNFVMQILKTKSYIFYYEEKKIERPI